jgi:hypothetical protein
LSAARTLRQWAVAGSDNQDIAIYNRLGPHIDRTASYLFSPSDLRFNAEFDRDYPEDFLLKADAAARYMSSQFAKQEIDTKFAASLIPALTYNSALIKVLWGHRGLSARLVMPWNFGVWREDINDLYAQEAMVETTYITQFELWRRISHLPNAQDLLRRAINYAKKDEAAENPNNYFHNILLAGTAPMVETQPALTTTVAGAFKPNFNPLDRPILAQSVLDGMLTFHELTVVNDQTGDYTTLQVVEPDIIVTRKRENLFLPRELPYVLIQPNYVHGYFWGASELQYLLKLQAMLRDRLEDLRQIMSLQYDKILAFIGFDGMTDELYDEFKRKHFISQANTGADVKDLTPAVPENAFQEIDGILKMMDDVSGFQNILSGQGEMGVRAATHAQILMRTASPRLRDRAILVERQCAQLGNLCFKLLKAKDARTFWLKAGDPSTEFLLSQIPDDVRIVVDSHSSSPVYEEEQKQQAAFLLKAGIIDGSTFVDMMPNLPMRDTIKAKFARMQAAQAQMMQEHPELFTKGKPGPKSG